MKKRKSLYAILLMLSIIFTFQFGKGTSAMTQEEEKLQSMTLVMENEYLELYLQEQETDIAVKVKESGDIWFSNPINTDEDEIATPYNQDLLKSQFSIRYLDSDVRPSEMDNYNDSIKKEQFEISYDEDEMTITYTLGESGTNLILPEVISEERFLEYFNQMDESAQKQVNRNYNFLNFEEIKDEDKDEYLETYPTLKDKNLYTLKTGVKDFKKDELMGYFMEVGYTFEDMENDMIENGYSSDIIKPYFVVPLTYKLDNENLLVSINPQDIEYNSDGFYLVDIDMMEYFGASSIDDEGYMFIPDGSGALIYFNNEKTNIQPYFGLVYGEDMSNTFLNNYKSGVSEQLSIKLPVFGIKNGNKAVLTIIEDGDALADISADVSGRVNSYNNVYAGFNYLQNGPISLGEMIGSRSFQMYSKEPYSGEFKLRYAFLSGDKADYSGMANYYRDYLVNNGKLSKNDFKDDLPIYLEFLGAIEKIKSFIGIKYESIESLTTFEQANEIVDKLLTEDINNIKVKYSGWMNGGMKSTAPTRVNPVSQLETRGLDLSEYIKMNKEKDIPVYFDVNYQRVYEDKMLDGYTENKYAPRYFDNTIIRVGEHLIPNNMIVERNISLISPYFTNEIVDIFLEKSKDYNVQGISIGNMARDLYSDYQVDRYTNRQIASRYYCESMDKLVDAHPNGLIADNANAYTLEYISDILKVPTDSNRFRIIDETIPFYQMVIRGYIEYAGQPMNLADNYTDELLKSIETGSGLYFTWIYEDESKLKDTNYEEFYSVNYTNWINEAKDSYHKMNKVFSKLQGQTIIHHEKLQDSVNIVKYEDGTEIVVNYNNYNVDYDGVNINSKDFAVVREEE